MKQNTTKIIQDIEEIKAQKLANVLENFVFPEKLFATYRYQFTTATQGNWIRFMDCEEPFLEKIGKKNLLGAPYRAGYQKEDVNIFTIVLRFNHNTGEVLIIDQGVNAIRLMVGDERKEYGLSGGYDSRTFTLNPGEFISLDPMLMYSYNYIPYSYMPYNDEADNLVGNDVSDYLIMADSMDFGSLLGFIQVQ